MKKITNKTKVIFILLFIFIVAGLTVISQIGMNFDLRYSTSQQVILDISKEFEISDIKAITDEVFAGENVLIQKVEVYEDSVAITTEYITEDEKTDLVNKINEKYEISLSAEDTTILDVPHTRGRDIVKPYIIPFVIALTITLVYMLIRYRKLTVWKVLTKTVGIAALAQLLLLCTLAITRIPVGSSNIPLVLTVYMLTMVWITTKFENQLTTIKEESKE